MRATKIHFMYVLFLFLFFLPVQKFGSFLFYFFVFSLSLRSVQIFSFSYIYIRIRRWLEHIFFCFFICELLGFVHSTHANTFFVWHLLESCYKAVPLCVVCSTLYLFIPFSIIYQKMMKKQANRSSVLCSISYYYFNIFLPVSRTLTFYFEYKCCERRDFTHWNISTRYISFQFCFFRFFIIIYELVPILFCSFLWLFLYERKYKYFLDSIVLDGSFSNIFSTHTCKDFFFAFSGMFYVWSFKHWTKQKFWRTDGLK